MKQEAN